MRGNNSQGHRAPAAEAEKEQASSREVRPKEGRLVAVGGRSGQLSRESRLG